jgi:CRISPR-associated protein Cmr5
MPDLEQERAAYAWQKASESRSKEYENLAKAAPALIMSNGLMQTLAFFESKGQSKSHFRDLSQHICHWLGRRFRGKERFPDSESQADFRNIIQALYKSPPLVYRQATEEAMALLKWIRQFASAVSAE